MSFMRCSFLVAACCGMAIGMSAGDDKQTLPVDPAIEAVVAYFETNGVKMKKVESSYWAVTDPKGVGYDVLVAFRAWPPKATEKDMAADLRGINLGFMLNAPARLAMSMPFLRGDDIEKMPSMDKVPVVAKLEKLFKEYRLPEPKK